MRRVVSSIFALSMAGVSAQTEVPELLKATRTLAFSLPAGIGYTQHGYRVYGPEDEWLMLDPLSSFNPDNGGMNLRLASTSAPVTIVQGDGTAFDALSVDVAEYSIYAIPNVVSFRGTKADGSVLDFDFVPDRVIDGTGPAVDFETVAFPAGWTGLVKLEVTTTRVALDNIVLRGLALDDFSPEETAALPLELLGTLEGGEHDSWGVTGADADHVYLWNQRYSTDPYSLQLFSPAEGEVVRAVWIASDSGGYLPTGETARVQGGELIWNQGTETRVLATVGSDGVTGISYPAPAGGKVLFANHWYQGHEKYAVFLAGPEGVTPILTPETVLPDGGTPHYFPRELHYTGSSFAIATSTTKSQHLFVVSFAGGPLRLSPANGDPLPGTNLEIDGQPMLSWLTDDSAGFVVETNGFNTPDYELVMLADGSWTASQREGPESYESTALPGRGMIQLQESTAMTPPGSPLVTYGRILCHDLASKDRYGLVAWMEDGSRHLLIREGTVVEGFGTVGQVFPRGHAAGGVFHVTARSTEGQVGLFRGRIPTAAPTLKAGAFLPMADGTVRFMVENLTHGRRYVVERAETLAGPWTPASRFTAGSPARSVLGSFAYGSRGFFRVVEEE